MRYKESATDTTWLPRNKQALYLWKTDTDGKPMIPTGNPNPDLLSVSGKMKLEIRRRQK
jgi:hypothetical protein